MISAFASAIASSVPSSSRCTGPMFVIAPTSGSAIPQSSAIWPFPRIAISSTRTSVSGGAARIASGSPTSVLKFSGLAWTRSGKIARQMSLTEVLPVDPVMPTVGQSSSRRHSVASRASAPRGSRAARIQPSAPASATSRARPGSTTTPHA